MGSSNRYQTKSIVRFVLPTGSWDRAVREPALFLASAGFGISPRVPALRNYFVRLFGSDIRLANWLLQYRNRGLQIEWALHRP
jgi:hypothetical protein